MSLESRREELRQQIAEWEKRNTSVPGSVYEISGSYPAFLGESVVEGSIATLDFLIEGWEILSISFPARGEFVVEVQQMRPLRPVSQASVAVVGKVVAAITLRALVAVIALSPFLVVRELTKDGETIARVSESVEAGFSALKWVAISVVVGLVGFASYKAFN